MKPRVACSVLVVLAFGVPAAADTRTFPEAECAYTLPNKDWEWLDPQQREVNWGKTLVFARNQRGVLFTLRFREVSRFEILTSRSYADFEKEMLSDGKLTKVSSKHVLFNGVPSYQFEVHSSSGVQFRRIRIMYANDRFYYLQVSRDGALETDPDVNVAILKFEFTGTPRPMIMAPEPEDEPQAKRAEPRWTITYTIIAIGMAVGVIFCVWWIFHTKNS